MLKEVLRKQLIAKLSHFDDLNFPRLSEEDYTDELESLYASLDLLIHYAEGIVMTYLKTGKIHYDITTYDHAFNQILSTVTPSESLTRIKEYKYAMDQVVKSFLKLVTIPMCGEKSQ